MKIKIHQPRLNPESSPELMQTAQLIGDFIEYWGFKKVHGRIWVHLFLSKTPLNSRQLVQLLKVSSALVCNSLAELLQYEVILEAGKARNGVLLYTANPNVGRVVAGVLRSRESLLLKKIQTSFKSMSKKIKSAPIDVDLQRVELLGKWIQVAKLYLELGIGFVGTESDPFSVPDKALSLLL